MHWRITGQGLLLWVVLSLVKDLAQRCTALDYRRKGSLRHVAGVLSATRGDYINLDLLRKREFNKTFLEPVASFEDVVLGQRVEQALSAFERSHAADIQLPTFSWSTVIGFL